MRPAVVCAPLAVEQAALSGLGFPVRRTGCGPARSSAAARAIAGPDEFGADPRPVLVAGLAGGLAGGVAPGDVVVATEVRRANRSGEPVGPVVPVPTAAPLAAALRALGLRVHEGPIVSVPRVVDGTRRAELARTGALAVDTESAWLAAASGGPVDAGPIGAGPVDAGSVGAGPVGAGSVGAGPVGAGPVGAGSVGNGSVGAGAAGPFAVVRVVVDTADAPLWHPGTPARGLAALRVLRRTRPAVAQWLAATMPRSVALAAPRSFCAGVERAVDTVERALQRHGAPVYVRRQIVHNVHVVRDLEARGAVFVQEVEEIPRGGLVVLAAHGVAPAVRAAAQDRELRMVDATCPLVAKVHGEVRRRADRGETVFLIGHADHEEVEGTRGEAPDAVVVVEGPDAARQVAAADPARVSYAMQTTLAVDEAEATAEVLRARFPSIAAPRTDDICYATTNRQRAVRAVAAAADLVLVLGSPNSSNSVRLVEVAERTGARARLVEDVGALDLRWLAGARRIGLTAGASAPSHLVDEVLACLAGLGPTTVTETVTDTEDVVFSPPKEVF